MKKRVKRRRRKWRKRDREEYLHKIRIGLERRGFCMADFTSFNNKVQAFLRSKEKQTTLFNKTHYLRIIRPVG